MLYTEVVRFRLKDGVDTKEFLRAAFRMDREFQPTQPGYVAGSRRTMVSDDGEWTISVDWLTKEDSERSQAAFREAGEVTRDYLAAMEESSIRIEVCTLYQLGDEQ